MNELRKFIRSTIIEGRVDDVAKKYEVPRVDVDSMSMRDPSGNNKYLDWMVKQRKEHNIPASKIENVVRAFHVRPKAFSKRDINKYDFFELRDEALSIVPSKRSTRINAKSGAKLITSFQGLDLYRIDQQGACQLYGAGTRWCVSGHNEGGYWNDYFGNTVLYMVIDTNAKRKYMITIPLSFNDDTEVGLEQHAREKIRVYDEFDNRYDDLIDASINFHDPRLSSTLFKKHSIKASNITLQQNQHVIDASLNDFKNSDSYKAHLALKNASDEDIEPLYDDD